MCKGRGYVYGKYLFFPLYLTLNRQSTLKNYLFRKWREKVFKRVCKCILFFYAYSLQPQRLISSEKISKANKIIIVLS